MAEPSRSLSERVTPLIPHPREEPPNKSIAASTVDDAAQPDPTSGYDPRSGPAVEVGRPAVGIRIGRATVLSSLKLGEIDDALRLGELGQTEKRPAYATVRAVPEELSDADHRL
ncbi:hypothetical protein ACF1BN_37070 [Streptomyces sp. NPDC014861]|uniref:hypothetical protein n=1 Tax=Streptomyces sp. NPDC014861 TaxID=3364923 RepID=UPI0037033B28